VFAAPPYPSNCSDILLEVISDMVLNPSLNATMLPKREEMSTKVATVFFLGVRQMGEEHDFTLHLSF